MNVQKSTRFIGIKVGKSNYSKNELNETKLPVRVIAQTAKTRSGWDTVLEGTEFKTTLFGADIQAGVGEKARADAKIILKGIVNRIQTEEKLESNSTVWQKQAGSGSTVETLKLPSFEGPALPKLTAPGGYIADIPKGNLKTEIEKLAKQPEYAYLKQLQTVKDVNWNQVQLAYDKWDYKQEGLTGAGAAIIALAVAAVTGGVGAGLIGAAQGTTSAAIANAAFTSLATQASISLVNNKGNVGKTLKELGRSRTVKNLVVAAATAGVSNKIGTSALANVSDKQWVNNMTVNLADAGSAALINTAVNGGSLKDNLEANILAALVNTAHGEAASKIKGLDQHYVAHKIAHAIAGCAAAAANKGKCQDGAIGAAVGEILGETLLDGRDPGSLNVKDRAKIIAKAKLAAGAVAALSKGDVSTAANAAAVAVENNSLNDIQDRLLSGNYALCMSAGGAESFCESYRPLGLPHFVSVSGEMKLPNKFGNRMVNGKLIRGLGSKNIKLGYFEASSLIFYLNLHAGG
ncbi:putative Hemagglutinin/hemolysin-related protein [Neisseria meningitidis]|nr:putative Hemagglutinin/hemolysin-related protein [Neisseria meningitidis]CWU30472.1 putative Hemagglutinin/hemolysin-related protein [Neisseria meningitidis]